jgi:hypothetical protein
VVIDPDPVFNHGVVVVKVNSMLLYFEKLGDSNERSAGACTVVVVLYSLPLYFPKEISHVLSFTILELKNLNRFRVGESKMMVEITSEKSYKLSHRKHHDPIPHGEYLKKNVQREILCQSTR